MRLIDADVLRKEIHCSYSDDLGICEVIDNMPTAYDIEAVVEKMENKINALGGASGSDAIQDTAVKEIMWCIGIIRSGGKEQK